MTHKLQLRLEPLEHRLVMDCSASPLAGWHNSLTPTDTNCDGTTAPLDVMIVINSLESDLSGVLPPNVRDQSDLIDVNADGVLSAIDALAIINVIAENPHEAVQAALDAAWSKWRDQGPESYKFEYRTVCGECHGQHAIVTVEKGVIVSAVGTHGLPVTSDVTIESMFDQIQSAISRPAHRIDATFDPATGFVVEFFVDYSNRWIDEEFGVEVLGFEASG